MAEWTKAPLSSLVVHAGCFWWAYCLVQDSNPRSCAWESNALTSRPSQPNNTNKSNIFAKSWTGLTSLGLQDSTVELHPGVLRKLLVRTAILSISTVYCLENNVNICGTYLTSSSAAQQCRTIRLCFWNLEPWSTPYQKSQWIQGSWEWWCICTPLTRHVGNLAILDRSASYLPPSTLHTPQDTALATSLPARSGSLPQVTGSPSVVTLQSPGSVLPSFERSRLTEIGWQQPLASTLSSVQETVVDT